MKNINSVRSLVVVLNMVSGLKVAENTALFGAKTGSQELMEISLSNMMEGKERIPATFEQWTMGIAQKTQSFQTSNSAQKQHKEKGRTLDGLDAIKTAEKIRLNIRYLAGMESGANGERWKKVFAASQPNASRTEIENIFRQVLPEVTDAIKNIRKAAGKRLHSLDSLDHAERSYFLTEKVEKAVEIEKAWQEISPPKTVLIRRK